MTSSEFAYNNLIETLDVCIEQAYEKAEGDKAKFRFHFLKLFGEFNAGLNVYIPKMDSCTTKNARNNLIRKEFNGSNHSELSAKYGLSLQYIYKIVKGKMPYEID